MKSHQNVFSEADELMGTGMTANALQLITDWLESHPADQRLYGEAVAFYYGHGRYEEALALFARYRERTGLELRSDYSREDILRDRARADAMPDLDAGAVVFSRMSVRERGRASGLWGLPLSAALRYLPGLLRPVQEIVVGESSLTLRWKGREEHASWADVRFARVETREVHAAYERFQQRVLHLGLPSRTVLIDVTPHYPDFRANKRLLLELQKHLEILQP